MRQLDIKAAARSDLRDIYQYSAAEFGIDAAESYLKGLRASFDRLLDHPFAGRVFTGVNPTVRVLIHRRHQVFYRLEDNLILIVRVLHVRRDSRTLLQG